MHIYSPNHNTVWGHLTSPLNFLGLFKLIQLIVSGIPYFPPRIPNLIHYYMSNVNWLEAMPCPVFRGPFFLQYCSVTISTGDPCQGPTGWPLGHWEDLWPSGSRGRHNGGCTSHLLWPWINTLRPRQNGRHFQTTFSNGFSWLKMYEFR